MEVSSCGPNNCQYIDYSLDGTMLLRKGVCGGWRPLLVRCLHECSA